MPVGIGTGTGTGLGLELELVEMEVHDRMQGFCLGLHHALRNDVRYDAALGSSCTRDKSRMCPRIAPLWLWECVTAPTGHIERQDYGQRTISRITRYYPRTTVASISAVHRA